MNDEQLLRRAQSGHKLTKQEASDVVNKLAATDDDEVRYTLINILGLTGDIRYQTLIEEYLNWPQDVMVAAMALKALCNYMKLASKYSHTLAKFIDGVDWDDEDDCKLQAISVTGEYLKRGDNAQLLTKLLNIFESKDERQIVREAAYSAIARAMGAEWADLPSAAHHFDLIRDVDQSVIMDAKTRAAVS